MSHELTARGAAVAVALGLGGWGCNCDLAGGTPTLSSLTPVTVQAGAGGFTLTLDGDGFVPGSTARWNGGARSTTYRAGDRLTAEIPAADVLDGGVALVTVRNPGGAVSGGLELTVEARREFASGPDWPSFDGDLSGSDGGSRGPARLVCVSATVPSGCPAEALAYRGPGAPASGWTATSSLAPAARWIWRGDVAPDGLADLRFAVFERSFELGAGPVGQIQVAADDLVEVRVNGSTVGGCGSVTDTGPASACQTTGATLELTPWLHPGLNTLTVVGQNGPSTFAGCPAPPCTYASNLAGVLFGGYLSSH